MEPRNRNVLIIIGAAALLVCCFALVVGAVAGAVLFRRVQPTSVTGPSQGPVVVVTQPGIPRQVTVAAATAAVQPSATLGPAAANTPRPGASTGGTPAGTRIPAPGAAAGTAGPTAVATPAPAAAVSDTVRLLESAVLPERDMRSLAMRLRPDAGNIPATVNPTPPSYKVGDAISFSFE